MDIAGRDPDYESTSWNEREDDYSSVAFWYQTGASTFTARAPNGQERHLPSLERVTSYARDHMDPKLRSGFPAETQTLPFYDGPQVLYRPESPESTWIRIPITVTEKEPLRLLLNMTTSYDFGTYQPYLVPVTLRGTARLESFKLGNPIDLYTPDIENKEFHLLDFWPEPGDYVLLLLCEGKNPLSRGYYLGIESVRLRERRPRVRQYGHDRDKDWRKEKRLYG